MEMTEQTFSSGQDIDQFVVFSVYRLPKDFGGFLLEQPDTCIRSICHAPSVVLLKKQKQET